MADDAFTGLLKPGGEQRIAPLEARARAGEAPVVAIEPQPAVRGRLNAIVLDLILLGLVERLLLAVTGSPTRSSTVFLLFFGLQFAYFFGYEARTGQTIGKRIFHVRVVTLAGTPPSPRQVAWRTVLRVVDSLPLFYASGLLSLIRTGRSRRQRIGDVVAGTTVVLDASGKPLRTPAWVLPVATIVAVAVSIPFVVRAIEGRHRLLAPSTLHGPTLRGFSGGPGSEHISGSWQASAQATSSIGYSNVAGGERYSRVWRISRRCAPARCGLELTLVLAHESPVTAPLVRAGDGWHAAFPVRRYVCGYTPDGRTIYWPQKSIMVLRFSDGGRQAQATERDFSATAGCGYGTATVAWTATLR
jgi:uncharacterized RDD family membrane protein YckC